MPQIFNERATPELSDWDRYAKIEYQRLAMEEDQGELVDEWDVQVSECPWVSFASLCVCVCPCVFFLTRSHSSRS